MLFIPVKCVISYDQTALIRLKAAGLTLYSSDKPRKKRAKAEKEEKSGDKLKSIKENVNKITDILKNIYRSSKKELTVEKLSLYYRFGLGDAAITGIYAGGVYTLFHGFGAFLYNNFKVINQKVDILPDFDNNINEIKVLIILKLRIINLIKMAVNVAFNLVK